MIFKLHMQVQNAVMDVEVIGQHEVNRVTKMIFLSAVLFLFVASFSFLQASNTR